MEGVNGMKTKHFVSLVLLFAFVFSTVAAFSLTANAGSGPPLRKCDPWDPYVVAGQCCPAPNNGLGVYTASGCLYEDNISCSCMGLPPGGGNPYNCPLYCGTPE
jgi:hypothetical protein